MAGRTTVCPLRSGSSGNAVLISGEDTRVLIDAGASCCSIEQAMRSIDQDPAALTALLVTHEHSDHISGVGVLMRKYRLPLYVNHATWQAMQSVIGRVDESLVHLIDREQTFAIGDFAISSFATPHDAVAPAGYRVQTRDGAITLMTDIGQMTESLIARAAGSRIVLIEANYDPAMLMAGPYPALLKQRVSSEVGHLSNEACAQAVGDLLKQGTEQFVLSHLSKENNYPELALLTVGRYLNKIQAQPGKDARISVARRFAVSEPVWL
jgi:phosphoribosyl 1,2-cyclic phosphodiesterase